jgi:hypothetical protein
LKLKSPIPPPFPPALFLSTQFIKHHELLQPKEIEKLQAALQAELARGGPVPRSLHDASLQLARPLGDNVSGPATMAAGLTVKNERDNRLRLL